ncbi:hypothetical protein VNO78_22088 [Psophocarpus tetragonolobus]|uniref:Uncharacterized protein n=1 Tax=Psophocarpus tetragonolobus TaxID=3891 RepID=A0AAN9SEB0_PSOTE
MFHFHYSRITLARIGDGSDLRIWLSAQVLPSDGSLSDGRGLPVLTWQRSCFPSHVLTRRVYASVGPLRSQLSRSGVQLGGISNIK